MVATRAWARAEASMGMAGGEMSLGVPDGPDNVAITCCRGRRVAAASWAQLITLNATRASIPH